MRNTPDKRKTEYKDRRSNAKGSRNRTRKFDDSKDPRDTEKQYDTAAGCNSPDWYASTPQLLSDAASLAYSQSVGSVLDYTMHTQTPMASVDTGAYLVGADICAIPGIMRINLLPTVGQSLDSSSPVNLAARRIYSWVRHANAGAKNYDSPDLMLYLLAADSVYSLYSFLMRAYGFARTYHQKNRYLAEGLIGAFGLDVDDFLDNLANVRYELNVLSAKISTIAVPATMPFFVRHAWLYQNVYKDSLSDKAQLYTFCPAGFHTYESSASPKGGMLKYVHLVDEYDSTATKKVSYYLGLLDEMVSKLIQDEDTNIMAGDILKAYGEGNLIKIGQIPEDFTLAPVYNLEVLSQIQNIHLVGGYAVNDAPGSADITQNPNTGSLLCNPKFTLSDSINAKFKAADVNKFLKTRMLSMYKDIVQPADTMVATRLLATTQAVDSKDITKYGHTYQLETCGSEVATVAYIYVFGKSTRAGTDNAVTLLRTMPFSGEMFGGGLSITSNSVLLSMLATFEMHPCVQVMDFNLTDGMSRIMQLFDIDNFCLVDKTEMQKMHETALLSLFNVPSMSGTSIQG